MSALEVHECPLPEPPKARLPSRFFTCPHCGRSWVLREPLPVNEFEEDGTITEGWTWRWELMDEG